MYLRPDIEEKLGRGQRGHFGTGDDLAVLQIDHRHVARVQPAAQQLIGKGVLHLILDEPPQGSGTQHRVEALLAQVLPGRIGNL